MHRARFGGPFQEPDMQFQEFPKALYRDGNYLAVADAIAEAAARSDGYDDWADDHARLNPAGGDAAVSDTAPKRKPARKASEAD